MSIYFKGNEVSPIYGYLDNTKFRQLVNRSITEVTAKDLAGITLIERYAFFFCRNLAKIDIPDSVTNIEQHAISYCESLQSIKIPDSVTNIGAYAFSGDAKRPTQATSCMIGSGVTRIGEFAFYYCNKLQSITIKAVTPPTLVHANAFDFTNNCPIRVPAQSLNAYKTATNWSGIASRIQAIQTNY